MQFHHSNRRSPHSLAQERNNPTDERHKEDYDESDCDQFGEPDLVFVHGETFVAVALLCRGPSRTDYEKQERTVLLTVFSTL
jgi:hypothetical protein